MRVHLNGLLLHDGADPDERRVFRPFDIWDNTPDLDVLLVPNGGGPGAVSAGVWQPKEKHGTIPGRAAAADRAAFEAFRTALLAACPVGQEVELHVEDDAGTTRRMFVLRAGPVEFQWRNGFAGDYTLPLVAPDPGKYALAPVAGQMGVWTGGALFRGYALDVGPPARWYRTYRTGNLILNPSFETDLAGWEANTAFGAYTTPAFVRDNTRAFDGSWSCKITWPDASGTAGKSAIWYRAKNLTVGKTYDASVKVWVPAGQPDVRLKEVFGASGPVITTKNAWATATVTFTAAQEQQLVAVHTDAAVNGTTCWVDTAVLSGGTDDAVGTMRRTYSKAPTTGMESATLLSDGDVDSDRVLIAVTGPLTAGRWRVVEESLGQAVSANLSLVAGQTVVFDCHARTAMLEGVDVTHAVVGDWPRLPPGLSTWRLSGDFASSGFASVEAFPRYS